MPYQLVEKNITSVADIAPDDLLTEAELRAVTGNLLEQNEDPEQILQTVNQLRQRTRGAIQELGGQHRIEAPFKAVNAESNDQYQLTMSGKYFENEPTRNGTFSLYYRKTEEAGGLFAFGISRALRTLNEFKFDSHFVADQLAKGQITPAYAKALLTLDLSDVTVRAVDENEFVGPNTPLMIVEGPLWKVQLLETPLLVCLDYATAVATRAAACATISQKPVFDFSARRAPGQEAGVISALATMTHGGAGLAHTGVPVLAQSHNLNGLKSQGTTAHAYTEAYLEFDAHGFATESPAEGELMAYQAYANDPSVQSGKKAICVLLDTVNFEVGLGTAVRIWNEFKPPNFMVRMDSNICAQTILEIYDKLDEAIGMDNVTIIISDDLKPQTLKTLRDHIEAERSDTFYQNLPLILGIGTFLARPIPTGMVYKLAAWEQDGQAHSVAKASANPAKASDPVVYTYRSIVDGQYRDINRLPDEEAVHGEELLQKEVDFTDPKLHQLRPVDITAVPEQYLLNQAKLAPIRSALAEQVRDRIQAALAQAQPVAAV